MKKRIFIGTAVATTLIVCYYMEFTEAVQNNTTPPITQIQNDLYTAASDLVSPEEGVSIAPITSAKNDRKKTSNVFWINNKKQQEITGREGTKIVFPENIFVHTDGSAPLGNVKIELEEYYKLSDMLTAKLSTTSGNKILETAGMIRLRAYDGRAELKLKDDAQYTIQFPRKNNVKDDFKLFYGEWKNETIDWKLAEEPTIMPQYEDTNSTGDRLELVVVNGEYKKDEEQLSPPKTSLLSEGEPCFINIASSKLRSGTAIREMDYFQWKLQDGQTLNQWFVSNFNPDLKMIQDFCLFKYRTEITFHLNKNGQIDSYYISKTGLTEYDRILANFMMSAPNIELNELMPTYRTDNACILTFGSKLGSSQQQYVAQFRSKYNAEANNLLAKVEKSDLEHYIFTSTQLGWINCDRFESSGDLVTVVVNTPDQTNCHVSMVFDDINSILKGAYEGDKIVFRDVPKNREVRIISIKSKAEQPTLCIKKHNTTKPLVELKDYNPFSIKELDQELKKSSPVI